MRRTLFILYCWFGCLPALGQSTAGKQREFVYEGAEVLPSVLIDGESAPIHSQGLLVTDTHFLVTGRLETKPKRAWLLSFDRANLEKYEYVDITPENVNGESLDHPGGFDMAHDGTYWIPISTSHRKGPSKICQYEIVSKLGELKLRSSFEVDDHIGAVCCLADDTIVGANWDTVDIYAWKTTGRELYRVKQSTTLARGKPHIAVQDWKRFTPDRLVSNRLVPNRLRTVGTMNVVDRSAIQRSDRGAINDKPPLIVPPRLSENGNIAIVGGLEKSKGVSRATIMIADLVRGEPIELHTFSPRDDVSRPITNEGMAVHGGKLFLLPEDIGKGAKVLRYRITDGLP